MTEEDHKDEYDESSDEGKKKLKLHNLDDFDDVFKKLGQKSYKDIWGKSKK